MLRPLLSALLISSLSAAEKPNIVVILCDDLGYGDLACYGHPVIQTPHLDRMAKEGIRFTSMYSAAPVCSPSRVGLMTGRSPNRAGVYDWIPPATKKTRRPDAREQVHLTDGETTIPKLLKKAGYATCLSGKWHCNARFNDPAQAQPNDTGFDHWFATQNNASPSHENPRNFVRNGKQVGPLKGYSCQLATDEAIRWMKNKGTPGTEQPPFFLYLAFHEPHEPVASPPELVKKYRASARNENEAQYFANVENVDLAVGRVLKELKETKRDQNTLVIFTSDNGPETLDRYKGAARSYGRPDPLRGMKLWTTEAGFRVVGIMRWPDRIAKSQESDAPVSSLDFLPTFCSLAGVTPPPALALDGTNISGGLESLDFPRKKPLIWIYYNALNEHCVAMRTKKWKVLAKLDGGKPKKFSNVHSNNSAAVKSWKLTDLEIYDIAKEVSEKTNLAATDKNLRKEMRALLEKQYRELVNDSKVWKLLSK